MDKTHSHIGYASLAQTLPLKAGGPVQLLPAGTFRARDGRPDGLDGWVCDAKVAQKLIAINAQAANPFVIDYEHQTLNAEMNGQPAPAAGWYKNLTWQEGVGLFADPVEWTERARAAIAANEYKFISPVFRFDRKTGEVLEILNAALTNNPALDGMAAVALRKRNDNEPETQVEEDPMNELLKKLLAALNLPATTSEADALAACAALKGTADERVALVKKMASAIGLPDTTAEAEVLTASAALKTAATTSTTPDPAKFVPADAVAKLTQELNELKGKVNGNAVSGMVALSIKEGKLSPALEGWATEYGNKDLPGLQAYLAKLTPIAALTGTQTGGNPPPGTGNEGSANLTPDQLAICKSMNIKPEDYVKALTAAA